MWTTYWWSIEDVYSDLCGEEFFTELDTEDAIEHKKWAKNFFPDENLTCHGIVSKEEAEMMGFDTY